MTAQTEAELLPVEIHWPDGATETVSFAAAGELLDKFDSAQA